MTTRALSSLALHALAGSALLALSGCGDDDAPTDAALDASADGSMHADAADAAVGTAPADALSAVMGATEIPYPVYPNGRKYRVGGENGLKIVVFQTEDSFDEVDEYYPLGVGRPEHAAADGHERLRALSQRLGRRRPLGHLPAGHRHPRVRRRGRAARGRRQRIGPHQHHHELLSVVSHRALRTP